jgi:hypothetical protein
MTEKNLPEAFADLTPYLDWALPTADERQTRRRTATREELKSFYNAILPRIEAILTAVDAYPLGGLPNELHPLYHMALSLAEVAAHIELYNGSPGVPFAFEESRFVAMHRIPRLAYRLQPPPDHG